MTANEIRDVREGQGVILGMPFLVARLQPGKC